MIIIGTGNTKCVGGEKSSLTCFYTYAIPIILYTRLVAHARRKSGGGEKHLVTNAVSEWNSIMKYSHMTIKGFGQKLGTIMSSWNLYLRQDWIANL